MFYETELMLTTRTVVLSILVIFSSNALGDINSLYIDADHYWDFEQTPESQIIDKRTEKPVTLHGSPEILDSPTGKGIYLQGTRKNSSLDLLRVSSSSCLFDPSTCTAGLSITMFLKFRRGGERSINSTQMFFGNSVGTEFRQGVSIFYDEDSGFFNATVFGSTNFCFRWFKLVVNSWTYIHLWWKNSADNEGMLNVTVEGNVDPSGYVTCGSITSPLPTERDYSLGNAAFPVAYFDNVAIWYRDEPPHTAPWSYITDFSGNTTLSLKITLDRLWDSSFSNNGSTQFKTLKNEIISQIERIYNNNDGLSHKDIQQFTSDSSGGVNAHIELKFDRKTSWEDSFVLQDCLENGRFLGGTVANITDCDADDGFFCEGLNIVASSSDIGSRHLGISFNAVEKLNHHKHLMGYTVLHKKTDSNDSWKPHDVRGGWPHYYKISGLKPYTNYSVRVTPYSFQAAGLLGPITILETAEEVPASGPVILEAYNINMTSVFVRWNESSIPKEDWHGIPRGFRVHGQGNPCKDYHVPPQNVGLNVSSFTVTGLQAWVVYIVKISGVTSPGHGAASEVRVKTNDSVPARGPRHIRITATSNHSVKITWNTVHVCHVHGPVVSYEVHLRDVQSGSSDIMHNVSVLAEQERRLDFTSLEIYWEYGVRIKAFTTLGVGPSSVEVTGMTDEWVPIVAPTNVVPSDPETTSIRLSWYFEDKVRDVLGILRGFRIFYQLANSSSAPLQRLEVNGNNIREAEITGLEIYRFYKISVAGKTSKGHGVISKHVYMRTLGTAPGHHPVPIYIFNTSSTSLRVTWGKVPDYSHHGEVRGYRVFLEESGHSDAIVGNYTVLLSTNTSNFTGLKKFTTYSARVRAYSLFGEGPDGEVTASTDEDVPTEAPKDLQLFNMSSTSLRTVWNQVPECCRHGIIRGYRLFLKDNNTGEFLRNETSAPDRHHFDFSSLMKFYGYSVSMLAFTIKGDGPLSKDVPAMTEEDFPIGAPFEVRGRNTSAWSLLIEWEFDPNVRLVLGVLLGFHVHYLNINDSHALWNFKTVRDPLARQTTLTGLEEYRDYNITVTAFTRIGEGAKSPFILKRTDEHVPRAPPSNIVAINTSSTSLRVDWGEVSCPDQLGIIRGYRLIMWRTNHSAVILRNITILVPTRTFSLLGLEKYTNYTIQVSAFTIKGEGIKSEPTIAITDEDVPTWRPSHITAWNTSSTSILLSWKPLADPYFLHGILHGYHITYDRLDGLESTVQVRVCSSTLSLEVESLDEYVEYEFRVLAYTVKGAGPFHCINSTTDQDVPGAPPQHVYGYNISKHDIRVLWEDVPFRDVNGILLGYMVFFNESSDEVFNETVPFPRKNVTLSFLRPYTLYTIQVLAFTIKGNGPKSPPITVRTEEEAPQVYPWNVTGQNTTSRSIYLQWSAIPPELVAGVLREYRVVYVELNDLNDPVKTHTLRLPIDQLSVNLTNLEKYTNYSFQIQGISKFFGVNSPPIVIITDQDVPSLPPLNIISTNTSSTSLLITWEQIPKKLVHGILLGYRVFYYQHTNAYHGRRRRIRSVETLNETVRTLPPNATSLRIFNLKKFTYYSFQIVGFTSKGDGQISLTYNVSTDEDIPSKPPVGPSAVNLSGPHSILVSWKPIPEGFVHGILLGYRILYRVLSIAEEDVRQPTLTTTAKPTVLNFTLTGLLNYAVYDIRVLAFTVKGDGAETQSIIAETCTCPLRMTTNWHSLPPYMKLENGSYIGAFPFILNWATRTCCLPCTNGHGATSVDYEHDREGVPAEKDNVSLVHKIEYETDLSFPIEGYRGQSSFGVYRYVPLMESAGVAFVVPVPSPEERASFVIWVATACFPMLLLSLLMMALAASVIWVLESTTNPEEFPSSFIGGLWEGFWWSFITCTTLGYGDKVPRTLLGRLFAIAWTLFGLVMISFLLADMTNALISYSLFKTTNKKVYGAKVGAIQGSPEYLFGLRKVARMNPVQQYHTYSAINKALKDKEVEGTLIDVYVLSMQRHLSSNRDLRVLKVFDYQKTYGVVLAGPSMKLEKCFFDFAKFHKWEIYHKIEETIRIPVPHEESIAEEISGGLFDPDSSQFSFSYLALTIVLGFALLCGLVGQIYCRKVKQHSTMIKPDKHFASLRQQLKQEVNTFYQRFCEIANELRRAHNKERRRLLERRRNSFFQITLNSVRKLSTDS